MAGYLGRDLGEICRTVVLAHVSEKNNHPEIVRLMASQALSGRLGFTQLSVVDPRRQTEVFEY